MLLGFLQGMRKLTKIDDQGVSSLIFTLNTLPVGCVFFAEALLFFVGGTLFFFAALFIGLLILKVLFKPPMPVATGFLELVAVFFLLLNALQLTSRQDATERTGANADTSCTSAISEMAKKKMIFLLKGGILLE